MKSLGTGLAVGIVLALGAGGCGSGGSGSAAKASSKPTPTTTESQPSGLRTDLNPPPAAQTARAAIAATRKLTSMHVTGRATFDGHLIELDLSVAQHDSCTGKIGFDNRGAVKGDIVSEGDGPYLRGNEAFYRSFLGTQEGTHVAALLRGRWLKLSTSALPLLSDVCSLDHYRGFFDAADVKQSIAVERGAHDEINGTPVLEIVLNQKSRNLRAWVAEDGPPYVVRIEMPGSMSNPNQEGGQVTFAEYNSPVKVKIPPANQTFTP